LVQSAEIGPIFFVLIGLEVGLAFKDDVGDDHSLDSGHDIDHGDDIPVNCPQHQTKEILR